MVGAAAAVYLLAAGRCGGSRGEKEGQQFGPELSIRTHRPASTQGRGKAHAHLCVVALLGGWLLFALSGGRRESGVPPTFVSVRSVVTDLSTCVTYVRAHLKHTCVKSYHNGTFLKSTVLGVFELTGLVTMGRSMAIYWPFNGHFHMQLGACSLRQDIQGICALSVHEV